MFFKTGAFKNYAGFTRNTCVGVSFKKVAFKFFIRNGLQHKYFSVDLAKVLRTAYGIEHRWLLST